MSITWKYKIDLEDASVFEEIEKNRGILFPEELKAFIRNTNAATPSNYNFMVGNNERVLGAILSFNHEEMDADSVFSALSAVDDKNLIPFGIDPFGNYICYSLADQTIVFWEHENGNITSTNTSLTDYINALY